MFKSKGRDYWKTRITLPDGRSGVFGCGTPDEGTARAVEEMVRTLRRRREWSVLELVVSKQAKLSSLFDAYESNRLPSFIAAFGQADLSILMDEWDAPSEKYRTQIRHFIKHGERFGADQFTKANISRFLQSLPHSGSTKVRYRAALSVFANWLVERDVVAHNPVRDVRAAKQNPARIVWLDRGQAKALIAALPLPYRAAEALMACTGIERQVIDRLRRRDIDLDARTVHAQGGKTEWRNRVVRPTEDWAWDIFDAFVRDFSPNALVFHAVRHSAWLRTHRRIVKSLGLPSVTVHDWRHTYAVQSLRDGYTPIVVAHQLGHRDAYLVITRYGRHVPSVADYMPRHAATPSFQALG